ncbi:hypothetical protein GBL_2708 [Geobacillus kaustophilus GBlys]|uniref:Uncharacterized protein n=1 Tax=Geobacillus kaustophilus GBlys TaxID=1337888 RepID=U2WUN9_GEOKU|nr:hypothetical protein GBL_2708 [Geobacillus kaustophilus GBlys]
MINCQSQRRCAVTVHDNPKSFSILFGCGNVGNRSHCLSPLSFIVS